MSGIKCSKCGGLHLTEDRFCEHCLAPIVNLNVQHFHMRWDPCLKF